MMSVVTARSGIGGAGRGEPLEVALGGVAAVHARPACGRCPTAAAGAGARTPTAHSAIAAIVSGRRSFGCGDVKRTRSMPSTASTARSRSANCGPVLPGAEVAAVGVDVLAEQRDLDDAVGGELLDLVHDVAHAPADLGARAPLGTMQNAHELSQPIWIVTHAECGDVAPRRQRRRVRLVLLEDLDDRALEPGPRRAASAAWCEVVGAEHDVDVAGAARTISSRSFWARQPPTAICRSGRSLP